MIDDVKGLISQQLQAQQQQQTDAPPLPFSPHHHHAALQPDQQRLVLHGAVLDNDLTLCDYDVHDGDTIHIVLRLAGTGKGGGGGAGVRPFHVTDQREPTAGGGGEWTTVHLKVKAM